MAGCKKLSKPDQKPPVEIDFSSPGSQINPALPQDTTEALVLAVSAMTSPKETLLYYEELIHYISRWIERPIKIEQFKTYKEVNDHLEDRHIDVAFICSGAFIEALGRFPLEILAVPVIHGKKTYNAYVIVHRSSSIQRFEDFRGKSFAFTDPLSNTGRLYALKRVYDLHSTPEQFFSKTIYTHAHDHSIQAVARGIVHGATIDGLIYDYLKTIHPEKVADIRVIEISEDYGMPPVVVHRDANPILKKNLRQILLNMHLDPQGKKILDRLLMDRFAPGDESAYHSVQRNLFLLKP